MMNEKILALDIGDVRIGIALSDSLRMIAQPLSVYKRVGYGPDSRHIAKLCEEHQTHWVLCGLPKNMNGSIGPQAEKVLAFSQKLKEQGLKVFFQDERMTTITAEKALIEGNMRRENRKNTVDKVAAAVILQQWLDQKTEPVDFYEKREKKMEIQNSIIELIDENGEEVAFEHLMTIEHEEGYYIILVPFTQEENGEEEEEEEEVVILKLEQDEKGEDCYTTIEDEALLEAVFSKFVAAIEEEEEYGEYDDEEEDDGEEPGQDGQLLN